MSKGLGLPPLYTEMKVKIDGFKKEMDKAAHYAVSKAEEITKGMDKANKVSERIINFGKKATMAVTTPIVGAGVAVSKFAIDYENAFAGVRKTTEATEAEYKKISDGIRSMAREMPASAVSIAEVAEAAGQLGIKKEDLLKFSKTMVDLGVTTNMSSTEAATSLARFNNIMGSSNDNVDRLGSSIVHLGNNLATTEREIVDMSMRLAGAGKQIGLTEPQVLGLAGALSSVGIEAEMGGTAMSKLLINMKIATVQGGQSLNQLADVAGVSAAEFKDAFEKDAVSALQMFLKGLNDAELSGKSAIEVLDEMGINEVRLRDTILRAASANEIFSESQKLANQGWDENTALQKEAAERYKTTASQIQIAKNKIIDLGISIGEKLLPYVNKALDFFGKLIDGINDLSPGTQDLIDKFTLFGAAIGPVSWVIGEVIRGFVKAKGVIGGVGTFIRSVFNRDFREASRNMDSNMNKSTNNTVVKSKAMVNALKDVEVQAKRTAASMRGISPVGGKGATITNTRVGNGKDIDVITSKTKKLNNATKDASKNVTALGRSVHHTSGNMKNAAPTITKAASSTSKFGSALSKSGGLLKGLGKSAAVALPLIADIGFGFGGTATAAAVAGSSLLGFGTSLAGLAAAALPVVGVVGAVAAGGYAIYKAVTTQAIPAVDLYSNKAVGSFSKVDGASARHVQQISEDTKKEHQLYWELSKNIKEASEGMYVGMYKDAEEGHRIILENVEKYKSAHIEKVNSVKDETISKFNELYGNSKVISEGMKADIIKDAEETAEKTIKSTEERLKRITELSEELKTATGQKALEMKQEITRLMSEQDIETINIVAKNKAEQETLIGNLKTSHESITAEHVSNVVKKMNELRDGSVKAAEETKDKQIKFAEEWKARKEIINGELTDAEKRTYEKMKKHATDGYEKATREAEKLRIEGIQKLIKEYGDFDNSIDYNTGELKTWFEKAGEYISGVNQMELINKQATYLIQYESMGYEDAARGAAGGRKIYEAYHYNGIDNVPYDGYHARLHRGERVLTAEENREYSKGKNNSTIINIDKVYNNTQNDVRKVAEMLDIEMRKQQMAKGIL